MRPSSDATVVPEGFEPPRHPTWTAIAWRRPGRSWLGPILYVAVRDRLRDAWPFQHVDDAPRSQP